MKSIYDVNLDEATQVIAEVKRISDSFAAAAKESHELVEYEAGLEEVRTKTRGEIVAKYTNLVEWVQLMYQYPQFEVNDEIYKQVRLAYAAVQRIAD